MLSLTENAQQLLRVLSEQPEIPSDGGLRIYPGEDDPGQLEMAVAPAPQSGDTVIDLDAGRVFVEGSAAELLSESTLDAEDTPEGTAFVIALPEG